MKTNLIAALCLAGLLTVGMANAQTSSMSATTTTTTKTAVITPDTAQLKQYVGIYTVPTGDIKQIIVTMERGRLVGEAVGLGQSMLIANPEVKDGFTVPDPGGSGETYATVQFARNDTGEVAKVLLSVQGMNLEGTREK